MFEASTRELQAGRMPILLGGDHCLAMGSIAAVAARCRATGRKLRVLWLDAHADFNTRDITPGGNLHGMPVACLCGLGPGAADRPGRPRTGDHPGPGAARSGSARWIRARSGW